MKIDKILSILQWVFSSFKFSFQKCWIYWFYGFLETKLGKISCKFLVLKCVSFQVFFFFFMTFILIGIFYYWNIVIHCLFKLLVKILAKKIIFLTNLNKRKNIIWWIFVWPYKNINFEFELKLFIVFWKILNSTGWITYGWVSFTTKKNMLILVILNKNSSIM